MLVSLPGCTAAFMQQTFTSVCEEKNHSHSDQKYVSMHANALYLIVVISFVLNICI